jgi:hypothetical protein
MGEIPNRLGRDNRGGNPSSYLGGRGEDEGGIPKSGRSLLEINLQKLLKRI